MCACSLSKHSHGFFIELLGYHRRCRFLPHQQKEAIMYKRVFLGAIAASMLISQTAALAAGPGPYPPQPPPPGYNRPAPPPANRPGPPPPAYNRPGPAYNRPAPPPRYRYSDSWRGSHGHFRPGYAIPSYYRGNYNRYIINDWRRYSLYAPPRGQQWLLIDGNFVLAAIGTGIIAQILVGGGY